MKIGKGFLSATITIALALLASTGCSAAVRGIATANQQPVYPGTTASSSYPIGIPQPTYTGHTDGLASSSVPLPQTTPLPPPDGSTPRDAMEWRWAQWDILTRNGNEFTIPVTVNSPTYAWVNFINAWIHDLPSQRMPGEADGDTNMYLGNAWDADGVVMDHDSPFYPFGSGRSIQVASIRANDATGDSTVGPVRFVESAFEPRDGSIDPYNLTTKLVWGVSKFDGVGRPVIAGLCPIGKYTC